VVLIEEPLDGFAPLLVRRPVPGHLDGRLGQAATDTQAAVGIVSLGGQIGDASGPGKLVDVRGDPPQDGDDPLMGGQDPVVQRMIGPGPDIDHLGHPSADQLVEPFGHVAQGLGLVGQTLRDGVTRGGVIGWPRGR